MEENSKLHSEEVQDIITKPPAWIMKWGITLCILILLMLGILSSMIHYPDLIKTHVVIYANGSSKPITANTNGRLLKLLVSNNQTVVKDQPLAFIEAAQVHEDVLKLAKETQSLKNDIGQKLANPTAAQQEQLKQIAAQFQVVFGQQVTGFSGNDNSRGPFVNKLNSIVNYIDKWEHQFIISAPKEGKVSLIGLISEGQPVRTGQPLFYVSNNQSGFYGEMAIPQYELSKVKKGQSVLIKLTGYRFEDFGIINGKIDTIASLPYNDSVYVSKVLINNNYNKGIILKNGLSAESDIVTQDISLINRLINSLKKAIATQ